MAAPEASIDDITVEQDLFYAAVKCEEDDESSLPYCVSVKQEPVDEDEMLMIPPAPIMFVDSLMPKSELEGKRLMSDFVT